MKYNISILFIFFFFAFAIAQKKEKIKGSKIVTINQKEISNFEALEVSDNIQVYLERGEKSELKIEADDNLHSVLNFNINANTLKISTSKTAISYKKLIVRVTYTGDLKSVSATGEAIINAIQEIQLSKINCNAYDDSKLFLNVNSPNFVLQSNDDSKIELNLKSEKAIIALSKNAKLKALINTAELNFDQYQKSNAAIEGDALHVNIRLDNYATCTANNFVISNAELLSEGNSKCKINAVKTITIDAAANSEIQLYGESKIEIKRFTDNAVLIKKTK